ncbi:MAG: DNA-3-methyladenine glycosylase [Anaerolineae bacterium]|nr:DNA-3-methyladenine glycosylase [Anaerolineae bacterium]
MPQALPQHFYTRPTLLVARELLGQRLVHQQEGRRLAGRIMEVEAYIGSDDLASHARFGKTARNAAMFGPPGCAYIYIIYGIHTCLNIVTERQDFPAAVLIRALEPVEGVEIQQRLRAARRLRSVQIALRDLSRGPGRLCQALAIDRSLNGLELTTPGAQLYVEPDEGIPDAEVLVGPRIGVTGDAQARNAPWRFFMRASPWVSGKTRAGSIPA